MQALVSLCDIIPIMVHMSSAHFDLRAGAGALPAMSERGSRTRAGMRGGKAATEPGWFVSSVEKAFQILRAFEARERSLSLTEISELTGLDKSTAQRFTYTLAALGYLHKDTEA